MVTQNDQLLAYGGVRLLPFQMLCTTRDAGITTRKHRTELGYVTKAVTSQEREAIVMRHRSMLGIFGSADDRRFQCTYRPPGMPFPKCLVLLRAIKFVDEVEIEVVGSRIIVKFRLG